MTLKVKYKLRNSQWLEDPFCQVFEVQIKKLKKNVYNVSTNSYFEQQLMSNIFEMTIAAQTV